MKNGEKLPFGLHRRISGGVIGLAGGMISRRIKPGCGHRSMFATIPTRSTNLGEQAREQHCGSGPVLTFTALRMNKLALMIIHTAEKKKFNSTRRRITQHGHGHRCVSTGEGVARLDFAA